MGAIHFEAKIETIGKWTIVRVPRSGSEHLPSRGMCWVSGNLNGAVFQTALEPDGKGSHWFTVNDSLLKEVGVGVDDTVKIEIEPTKDWPDPKVPADVKKALTSAPQAYSLWRKITPMARWDWVRWIGSTKQAEIRKRRIEVACSKLTAGKRRPCCFNRTQCTDPWVSNKGVLLEPTL
jgi:hypothetical protein